jgi:hypothetical protein
MTENKRWDYLSRDAQGGHGLRSARRRVSMLRIAEECLGGTTVVRVAGRLVGEGVAELGRVCAASSRPLLIDLTELLQADDLGLALLRSLRESGAGLTGVSPFVELLLESRRSSPKN